jgi:rfaE bifunctional protein nucleotidyltransferase chain/domain
MAHPNPTPKLMTLRQLLRHSEQMRADGRALVLTNGCFDLLHVGHVRYLAAARALGDGLAVALNDDRSVCRLKGPGRPLNTAGERAEVLAALCDVDFITIFEEDEATDVVTSVRPSVYVKGGDYSDDPLSPRFPPEGRAVRAYGGRVVILPFVPGKSTSELVRRLRANVR